MSRLSHSEIHMVRRIGDGIGMDAEHPRRDQPRDQADVPD